MCERLILWTSVDFGKPFQCPQCKETLRVPRGYLKLTGLLDLAVAALVCATVGIRGFWLLPSIVATYAVVGFLSGFAFRRFWPPTLEYVPVRERYT